MTPDDIIFLLKENASLCKFIIAFHNRLALDNPKRDVAVGRTPDEIAMDSLGRLLVGDEICVAIAADEKTIYVASNQDNHAESKVSFQLNKIIFKFNEDGTKAEAQAQVTLNFHSNNQAPPQPVNRTIFFGKYDYNSIQHNLTPLENESVACEASFTEHGITAYPYPISWHLTRGRLALPEEYVVMPEQTFSYDLINTEANTPVIVRLDPLYRRTSMLVSHLGMICRFSEEARTDECYKRFEIALRQRREWVIAQTLGWELPARYNLGKTLRRYDTDSLRSNEKADHRRKESQLSELRDVIQQFAADFNKYESANPEQKDISQLLADWVKLKVGSFQNGTLFFPDFIKNHKNFPPEKFLALFETYLYELIYLERYIAYRSTNNPNVFTKTLAKIGAHEDLGGSGGSIDEKICLIDDLKNGTHAEVRLFYSLLVKNQDRNSSAPYFGITQLCCACCHTLFKSHNLNYQQGSMHRAGTQATQFSNWIIDQKLRGQEVIAPFFGGAYSKFESMEDNITLDGKTLTCKEWAFLILQDLASLWFRADQNRLNVLKGLGFREESIVGQGSPYPNKALDSANEQKAISNIMLAWPPFKLLHTKKQHSSLPK